MKKLSSLSLLSLTILLTLTACQTPATRKQVIDAQVQAAIEEFYELSPAGEKLARQAKGVLVFPSVKKAGVAIGGEYGEGALLINGQTVQYYNIASASIGFQLGVQVHSQVILFMEDEPLERFRESKGWEVGVDGSVAIATLGAGGQLDSKSINQPVIGFVFGNKGLMYSLSLEGAKITQIDMD